MRRGALLVLAAGVLLALPAGSASGRAAATIHFSFQGYVNDVRVRPPLVGAFQLGVTKIHGSGVLAPGTVSGTFVVTNDPLYSRYPFGSVRGKVIGYSYYQAAHAVYTKITLTVEITQSSNPKVECAPGQRGTIVLYDSAKKLSNVKSSDYITVGHWSKERGCGAVHGWTNEDAGPRTSPTFGGPPNDGQWAIVRAS